jgi:thiamine pyrophosphokinase
MTSLRAVVIADGDLDAFTLRRVLDDAGPARLLLAADGGALRAESFGIEPDLVVGDGDSLGRAEVDRLAARGIAVEIAPVDKDESDAELCVRAALGRGAGWLRLVGVLGGPRVEHAIANLLLLAHPMLDGVDAAIVAARSTIRRMGTATGPGALAVVGRPGDHVSLLACDSVVEGVRTHGLRFPLGGEPLYVGPARGLSNELLDEHAAITSDRGRLLVVHTPASAGRPHPEERTR